MKFELVPKSNPDQKLEKLFLNELFLAEKDSGKTSCY